MDIPLIRDEHDAMQVIIQGLKRAAEGADAMFRFRPDQPWGAMAQTYRVCAASAYKLAEEAAGRSTKQ